MDKRWREFVNNEIDALARKFIDARLTANRHFKKPEVVAYVMRRWKIDTDSPPEVLRVVTEDYVGVRAGRLIREKVAGTRKIEGYPVPGEGYRYRAARMMKATEFRAVTREYVERAEALQARVEFQQEVVEVAEQMGLFDADDYITAAYDQVVERRGNDPLAVAA